MSKIEVNEIVKASGSTLTIGGSGTAVSLGSGATQTGFGRSGAVDWETTIKTGDFTAENGKGYFINTTGGVITLTLPASPSAGNIIAIKDYARKFGTNKLTIARNGSKMDGEEQNFDFTADGSSATIIFMDTTKGWSFINDDEVGSMGTKFVTASGGNATLTSGNFKTHIFTSPGNFVVSDAGNTAGSNTLDYVIVAGGGGGGRGGSPAYMGGGAGAGGFRLANSVGCLPAPTMSPLATGTAINASAQTYPIVVGAGGAAASGDNSAGSNGSVSSGFSLTSAGGGKGAAGGGSPESGGPGGSGGGSTNAQPAGTGNTPPVSPPQGNPGGVGHPGNNNSGAGGGGAGAAGGGSPNANRGGDGGIGSFISDNFFGSPNAPTYGTAGPVSSVRYFAGGGSGSSDGPSSGATPTGGGRPGGSGGGGNGGTGGNPGGVNAGSGTANTGGGGGGGSGCCSPGSGNAGAGGSGIVMIRYKFQ